MEGLDKFGLLTGSSSIGPEQLRRVLKLKVRRLNGEIEEESIYSGSGYGSYTARTGAG